MPGSSEDNSYNSDGNGTLSGTASLPGKGDPSSAAVPDTAFDTASDASDQSPLSALSSRLTESESAARNHRRINITWWQAVIAFIAAILIVGTGGAIAVKNEIHHQEQMHAQRELELYQEMKRIVHSEECRKIIEATLREWDAKSLQDDGVIRTYTIDDSSIKDSPMGGIYFSLVLNHDNKFTASISLIRSRGATGILKGSGSPSLPMMKQLYMTYGDNATPEVREWAQEMENSYGKNWLDMETYPNL